uniref:C-type lectin domain-containing protein n=1 Tax=Myripristis murdjan TaxID=586833 RepID=A0A667XKD7_9TELE
MEAVPQLSLPLLQAYLFCPHQATQLRRCSEKHSFYCSYGQIRAFFVDAAMTWYDAKETCQGKLLDLAIVTQQNEYQFDKGGWIGLYREKNTLWKWSGKEQSNYTNWAPNEPSTADCGSIDLKTKQLHSTDCSKKLNYTKKKKKKKLKDLFID